jgi:5'-3' exonuclease
MQVYLVDGTFELFRAYYGAPSHTNSAGQEVGATRALLRSLAALVRQPEVTHIACAFDHVIESFRNNLFAGYKTGDGIEPALKNQFGLAERASQALGIITWPMVEFEADDALATAAARFANDEAGDNQGPVDIVLCSPDKDLAQCVHGTRVIMWDRLRDKKFDEAAVRAKFGVDPQSIAHWLALVGDAADGIPGVPKWGAKSAATVLAHYRSIDQIPNSAQEWDIAVRGASGLAESLRTHREAADLYVQLATLRTDVPLPQQSVDDLRWQGVDVAALMALCYDIDAMDVVQKFGIQDTRMDEHNRRV